MVIDLASRSPSKKRKHREDDSQDVVDEKQKKKLKKKEKKEKKERKEKVKEKSKKDSISSPPDLDGPSSPLSTRNPLSSSSTKADGRGLSSFHRVTTTLYLPLSPVSISPTHAVSSLLVEHISPLLLTYYPPVRGIVLAYSDPSVSSTPPSSPPAPGLHDDQDSKSKPLALATAAGEYGVLYLYLTVTLLVFRPERGQTLEGWVNVQSEGFLGAIVLNLFSVGIERRRLPADWKWVPPGDRPAVTGNGQQESDADSDKENFSSFPTGDDVLNNGEIGGGVTDTGYLQTKSGKRVRGVIKFRVRDVDVIPGREKNRGFLSLEGTMLDVEDEEKLVAEERQKALQSGRAKGTIQPVEDGEGTVAISDDRKVEKSKKKEKKERKEKKDKEKRDKKDKKRKKGEV